MRPKVKDVLDLTLVRRVFLYNRFEPIADGRQPSIDDKGIEDLLTTRVQTLLKSIETGDYNGQGKGRGRITGVFQRSMLIFALDIRADGVRSAVFRKETEKEHMVRRESRRGGVLGGMGPQRPTVDPQNRRRQVLSLSFFSLRIFPPLPNQPLSFTPPTHRPSRINKRSLLTKHVSK